MRISDCSSDVCSSDLFKALADARVDYVVVGGMAVIMHGHLRATRDLDLVIGLAPDNCTKAVDALAGIGLRPRLPVALSDFANPEKREDWADNRHMMRSEEQTSELQSLMRNSYAVFCLKKKKHTKHNTH